MVYYNILLYNNMHTLSYYSHIVPMLPIHSEQHNLCLLEDLHKLCMLEAESARKGAFVARGMTSWLELAEYSECPVWLDSPKMFNFPLVLAINPSLLDSSVERVAEAVSWDVLLELSSRSKGLLVSRSIICRAFVARLVVD